MTNCIINIPCQLYYKYKGSTAVDKRAYKQMNNYFTT